MKRRIIAVLCLLALVLTMPQFAFRASAEVVEGTSGENISWSLDTQTGVLTVSGTGELPRSFWVDVTHKEQVKHVEISEGVTGIPDFAFILFDNLTSISIPASTISVYATSFPDSNLNIITVHEDNPKYYIGGNCLIERDTGILLIGTSNSVIPADGTITRINDHAFCDLSGLTSIVIPEGVTSIGRYAFLRCSDLTSVSLPDSLQSISEGAFAGCNLDTIAIGENNPIYYVDGNCLINRSSKTLIAGTNNSVIPADGTVTGIGETAFDGRARLQTIEIPATVTSIGVQAFEYCTELISIKIPEGITSIELGTFSSCTNLTSVDLPDSLTTIDASAFSNCTKLTSIEIPANVNSISDAAFTACCLDSISIQEGNSTYHVAGNSLIETATKTLVVGTNNSVIPNDGTVTIIGSAAFWGRTGLTSIEIPSTVTTIRHNAFRDCAALTFVEIPNSVTTTLYGSFKGCIALASVKLPGSLTTIGESSFENCIALASIEIPDSVTSIEHYAFYGCENLKTVTNHSALNIQLGSENHGHVAYYAIKLLPCKEHTWSNLVQGTETHYYECTNCQAHKDEGAHLYDNACDATCNTCGYVQEITHDYTVLKHSDTEHWQECGVCHGEKPGSRVAHSGGTANCTEKAVCEVCRTAYGETDGENHDFAESWTVEETEHFHECTRCQAHKDGGAHVYDNACDTACNTCGYEREITHSYALKHSGTEHWYECAVCQAEQPDSRAAHTFKWKTDQQASTSAPGICHEECACGAVRSENTEIPQITTPPTGDSTPVALLAVMLVLSCAAFAGTIRKKKAR